MKKKVLYGAALALFASVSMGTLQSCKDDLSDAIHQEAYNNKVLQNQIDALQKALDTCKSNCATEIAALKTSIENLQNQINANKADADATKALAQRLETELKTLSDKVALLYTNEQIDNKLSSLETLLKKYTDDQTATVKTALESLITKNVTEINTLINNMKSELENDYNTKINNLNTDFTTKYNDLAEKVTAIETESKNQQEAIKAAQNEIDELWKQVNSQNELINQVYQALTDDLNEVKEQYAALSQNLDQLYQEIYGTGGLQEQMLQLNQALRDDMIAADEEIYLFIEQVREEASMYWRATEASLEELRQEDEQLWQQLTQTNEMLGQVLNAHKADIEALEEKISDLNIKYDNLLGRLQSLITGILIQGTDNPIFGNFSLPLGIKTNMLFNWFGYNSLREFEFPSANSAFNYYDPADEKFIVSFEELDALNPVTEKIKKGYLGEVELGRLYLTVNPFNHNFDNTAFSLETTNGERLPYELRVKKSDEKLYWGPGSTRATIEGNGFYSADVVMPATSTAVNATKIEIEEGLKTAAKDLLKDRSRRSAVNMLKAVYSQMHDMLPLYGVRYDWTSNNENYGVMSNYDLAVATARPLSYSFLYGKGTTRHLPIYGHIDNIFEDLINKDKFKFELNTKFEIDGFTISFEDLTFEFNVDPKIEYKGDLDVTITIPEQTCEGTSESGERFTVTIKEQVVHSKVDASDLTSFMDSIKDGFKQSIEEMADELNAQINGQIRDKLIAGIQDHVNDMLKDIQNQFNNMLSDLESQINGQIGDMIDDIMSSIENKTGGLFNRVNDAIDIYNKVAGKINNVLSDPNHYLQVAMFYKGNGTIGILSNDKMHPTKFLNAGGNAISLYASSYSAEIFAPAYKKYVAVSNVYNADGTENVAEKANISSINTASGLNKVFPGVTKRVGVAASKLKKDLVYEIIYQGVDYSGKTSTQKFYITVK